MSQKSALLSPGIIIGADVKDLFPLTLTRPGTAEVFEFQTFEAFNAFIESLSGYYSVYRKDNELVVDKYVINSGMYTVFRSNP